MRAAVLAVVAACAQTLPSPEAPTVPRDRERHFTIWLGGARVGTATERETWTASGVVLRREEAMRFLRGEATVALTTTIEVVADRTLAPSRVTWSERSDAAVVIIERHAEAVRDHAGHWTVDTEASVPDHAVPAELVPLITRRDGRFAGSVFLPGRGFLAGSGRIDPIAPDRLVARLDLDGGAVAEATMDIDSSGEVVRVVDGDGVIAIRATADVAAVAFAPVDLIAATAIPITGTPSFTLVVDATVAVPPIPGQSAHRDAAGTAVELSPRLPGALAPAAPGRDRSREITGIVAEVRARIAPDLSAHVATRDAGSATAGDCTTFALAYAGLALRRAIPTRLVTGLRVDGNRLVRHRWAVSWTGRAWIAVDAAYGSVPAGGDLVGLAIHGADDAGLVAGEAALTQIRSAAWQ
ncbi:MAG: transglutaminase domain-containing protein [Kofleriaceae bacterium]